MSLKKVCLLGANSVLGRATAFQLKVRGDLDVLALHDNDPIRQIALDLSYIPTACRVYHFFGDNALRSALSGAGVVVFAGGADRPRASITEEELLSCNAQWTIKMAKAVSYMAPNALMAVLSSPVNSLVPIIANFVDPARVFGFSSVNQMRLRTAVAVRSGVDPKYLRVSVVGGQSKNTIVPLISNMKPDLNLSQEQIGSILKEVKEAGTNVLKNSPGQRDGNPCWSVGYEAANFITKLMRAAGGQELVPTSAYVKCDIAPGLPYFCTEVKVGPDGVQSVCPLPSGMSAVEHVCLQRAVRDLHEDIQASKRCLSQYYNNASEVQ